MIFKFSYFLKIIHRPDFCEPSRAMRFSSCIFFRCFNMALLLILSLFAISLEVMLALSAISWMMASLVSVPLFWTTLSPLSLGD